MNVLEFNDELDEYANIKNHIVSDHNDSILKNKNNVNTVNFIHLNIRSINKNFENLLILLESLSTSYQIIILSETWKIDCLDKYHIKNYNIYYSEGTHNQNDGVLIYVRNEYLPNFTTIKLNENTFSNMIVEINSIIFNITAVYRLPSTDINTFFNDIREILLRNKNKNEVEIFAGDINIDLLKKQDNSTNEYLNLMVENGFIPYINEHTRVTNDNNSCLDHFFIKVPTNKSKILNISPIILHSDITDHFPIILKIENIDQEYKESSQKKKQK